MKATLSIFIAVLCFASAVTGQAKVPVKIRGVSASQFQIPTVSYCELVQRPARYDRKVIRIASTLMVGMEAVTLYDSNCYQAWTLWVEFGKEFKTCTTKDLKAEFDRLREPLPMKPGQINQVYPNVDVTFIGRFEIAHEYRWKDRDLAINRGFGHMNSYPYQLTVTCLKAASPAKQ